MDKALLRQAIIARLKTELENITKAALMAHDEATHEESKPENKYDTHAQEAAYLAEGQARLAAELQESISLYQGLAVATFSAGQAAALGAIVTLETNGRRLCYLLGPRNGGLEIECNGTNIIVITPQSPLGRLILGRRAGESIPPQAGGRSSTQRIVAVE